MKRSRLLLINPWILDFSAYDFWAKPLGLLYIAGVLREEGFAVDLIDCLDRYHPLTNGKSQKRKPDGRGKFPKESIPRPKGLEGIRRRYSRYGISKEAFLWSLNQIPRPDAILFTSMMTYWYPGVIESIVMSREVFPNVPILLGGVYATLCPNHAASQCGADLVIEGHRIEGLLRAVEEVTGSKGQGVVNHDEPDALPYPAFDLIRKNDYIAILSSRGCPNRCTYCASRMLFKGFVRRDPSKVVDEIGYWSTKFGIEDIAFYDDALLVDKEDRLVPLLEEIMRRDYRLRFHTPNGLHVRGLTDEIATLLFRSGFREPRLGLEMVDPSWQEATGGKVTNKEFERAMENLLKAGFLSGEISVYLLTGLPGQRVEQVMEGIQAVIKMGARPNLAEYSPVPGTKLWEEALRLSPFPLAEDPIFHNNSIMPCQWEGFSYNDLRELKDYIHQQRRLASGLS